MVRRALFFLVVALLAALPALAGRAKVPALEAATLLAEPKAGAAKVVDIKKGDAVLVLGKQGEWSQVLADGGKKGWVKTSVVSAGGLDSIDTSSVEVAAAEDSTALAIRAKRNPPKTAIIGVDGLTDAVLKSVADGVKKDSQLKVVDARVDTKTKGAATPAGGLAGAKLFAKAKRADLVVALRPDTADPARVAYEIVDVKNGKVLGTGSAAADQLVTVINSTTAELTKSPAAVPAASPVPTVDVPKEALRPT